MIIPYIGNEKCDLLYFVVKLGLKTGKKILVLDNSFKGDFYEIYKRDVEDDILKEDNLTICRNYKLGMNAENYDVVFIYEGVLPQYEGLADLIIMAPSCEKTDWDRISNVITKNYEKGNRDILFILRDKVNRKVSVRTLAREMGLEEDRCMEIWFDEKDYSLYCSLLENRKSKIVLSSGMYEAMEQISLQAFELDAKTLKKLISVM